MKNPAPLHVEATPWYRVPFVWLVVSVPLTAVIVGVVLISIATTTYDGLVVDDYYKRGKEINRVLARDRNAAQVGVQGSLSLDLSAGIAVVDITADLPRDVSEPDELLFLHPTRSGRDQRLALNKGPDGRFFADFSPLSNGRWIVQIGAKDWRLVRSLTLPEESQARLTPH